MTLFMPSSRAANCLTCLTFTGIICLTLTILLTDAGNSTYQQIKGVAMRSYHSRQIADLLLFLSEFSFFNKTNCSANILLFCRYIDDDFMLTKKANLSNIITNLCSSYLSQIPITFTSNHNTTHYLDLTLSFNHFTIKHRKGHRQVYQKPQHKYMYPHFSSNHPQHIFTTHFHWYH